MDCSKCDTEMIKEDVACCGGPCTVPALVCPKCGDVEDIPEPIEY